MQHIKKVDAVWAIEPLNYRYSVLQLRIRQTPVEIGLDHNIRT
jgi:hypothetical protein